MLWHVLWLLLIEAFSAFCWVRVEGWRYVVFSSQATDDSWWAGWHQACSPLMLFVTLLHSARICCMQCVFICAKLFGFFSQNSALYIFTVTIILKIFMKGYCSCKLIWWNGTLNAIIHDNNGHRNEENTCWKNYYKTGKSNIACIVA